MFKSLGFFRFFLSFFLFLFTLIVFCNNEHLSRFNILVSRRISMGAEVDVYVFVSFNSARVCAHVHAWL